MGKFLLSMGQRLVISRRDSCVRQGFIFAITNLLLISGLIFILELVLILTGVENIIIPWTSEVLSFFHDLVF
ncbi:MAG TPA: hypothetical protein VKY57_14140 [Chitinispirillaceae bacterium]|nr:hypothetical protein [Chitinispirillaceae bacterium]